jgi:GTPase involved in cell partitioning and DNA repair
MAKHMLGEAREKFATIAGPQGGSTLNGTALKTEAKAEMEALMDELNKYGDGSAPLTFILG